VIVKKDITLKKMTLVVNVTILVMNVLEPLKTVPNVLESENSLPIMNLILQMNVSAHPTIMKHWTELAMNVILNVQNVQPLLRIVTHAQLIESKKLNQNAHTQMEKKFAKIVLMNARLV